MCVSKNLLILTFHKLKHSISIKVLSFTCRKCINCDLDFGIDFNPYVNNSLANIHIKVFYFFIKRFLCPARLLLFGTFLIKLPKFVVKIYYYIILVIDIRVKLLMSDTDKKVPSIPKAIDQNLECQYLLIFMARKDDINRYKSFYLTTTSLKRALVNAP